MINTITLPTGMTFSEALNALLAGKCLGIKPGNNSNYVELYKPHWMNKESPDFLLRWNRTHDDSTIRSNQYLELWYPVIIDHRTLPKPPEITREEIKP